MEAYRTHYRWDSGLSIRDWRYVVRIANVDATELQGSGEAAIAAQQALIRRMISAAERIPAFGLGRASWYVNRTVREALRHGILERTSNQLSWETVEGKRVMTFDDIPVRRCDALHNNEARVVGA